MPGKVLVPDPSLGGVPPVEGPTTHRLGVAPPVDRGNHERVHRAGVPGRDIDSRIA
jgi:hypothetical protein